MQFSKFGEKFIKNSGILQLMDDLGNALNSEQPINMLGGGNPARIDTVNQTYWAVFKTLAEGQKVAFILGEGKKGPQAEEIEKI